MKVPPKPSKLGFAFGRALTLALMAVVAGASALTVAPKAANALLFVIDEDQNGDGPTDPAIQIEILENAGALDYTVSIVPNPNNIGDLRGSFIDITLPGLLDPGGLLVVGADVSDVDYDSNSAGSPSNNVNPLPDFDVAVEIGTQGIGTDDIQTTSFTLSHNPGPLTLDMVVGERIAVRVMSVGPDGSPRDGSLKIQGTTPEPPPNEPPPTPVPEPALLALLGAGLLGTGGIVGMRRRRQKAVSSDA